jgi:hypothetical protein
MSMPQLPQSGYLPPSRSTSVTRKPQPVTTPLFESSQPFPSPAANGSYGFDVRPGGLQRQSSYGFSRSSYDENMMDSSNAVAGPSSPAVGGYDAFAGDAFAPVSQDSNQSDPWARIRQAQPTSAYGQQFLQRSQQQPQQINHNPWAGFGQSGAFAPQQSQHQRYGGGRLPTPPDEDDEMDMEMDEEDDTDDEDDFDVDGRAGQRYDGGGGGEGFSQDKRTFSMSELNEQQQAASLWQRGRRKT